MNIRGVFLTVSVAIVLLGGGPALAQVIFSEDFNGADPGLTQIDTAPNDAGDGSGDGSETGPLYCGQFDDPNNNVDAHWDRGSDTGGRQDDEYSVLAIGQTLTETDTFWFSLDANIKTQYMEYGGLGYVGLHDSTVSENTDPGHALFYLRPGHSTMDVAFGLAEYHYETPGGSGNLSLNTNYRFWASYDPAAVNKWSVKVTNLDTSTVVWNTSFNSSVTEFTLDLIGLGAYSIGSSETVEMTGTSDNWIVAIPEPATILLAGIGVLALLLRRRKK